MNNNSLCIVQLNVMREKSDKANGKIASYILSGLDSFDRMTISSLAEATETSYATVCRFLKDLGVSGFKEFKRILQAERESHRKIELDFDSYSGVWPQSTSYEQIAKEVCDFSASVVSGCPDTLNNHILRGAAGAIRQAGQIYFVGLGASAITAQYAYTKIFRLNPSCSFDRDTIIAKMKATLLQKGDLLFAVSSSGRTKSVLEIAQKAKRNGATVLSVTDFADSPLSALADISICTTLRNSNKYLDTDFPLIHGQITMIDVLYSCVCHSSQGASAAKLQKTKEAVNEDKLLPGG
ncbi:MAG: MurR/RpiR family transcriptional regulator [Clostridia bacterium]|nr:MurR/RpiR family transcriptional regulator [Clostridia bacterium]